MEAAMLMVRWFNFEYERPRAALVVLGVLAALPGFAATALAYFVRVIH
jgi:hypothetical protein